jgi:uncharacterized protein
MNKLMSLAAATVAALLGGCERSMIYFPQTAPEARLVEQAASENLVPWRTENGERIGWMTPPADAADSRPAVVVFHGNAGHAAHRAYYARGFAAATRDAPWQVYLFEYPGYGSRPGAPSESALTAAALAAVQSVRAASPRPLYLVGESLGGGVACAVAAQHPEHIHGLLLVTPFSSLQAVAQEHYPAWLVGLLLRERYDNVTALSRYRGPVAVLLAGRDEVVPATLGRALYDSYGGPKRLWVQEASTHNTLSFDPRARWWREVVDFLQTPRA